MKKIILIIVAVIGIFGFAKADDVVATGKTQRVIYTNHRGQVVRTVDLPQVTYKLPDAVVNPRTYQKTNAVITYVRTDQLVARGHQIIQEYAPRGTVNRAGYQPHYDPNIHADKGVFMRIPRNGQQLYGNRW